MGESPGNDARRTHKSTATVEDGPLHDHGESPNPQIAMGSSVRRSKTPNRILFLIRTQSLTGLLGDRKIAESVCTGKENPSFSRLTAGFAAAWSLQVTVS